MLKRHTQNEPCPACEGHPSLPQGQGIRCIGFNSGDQWFHCSRLGEGTRCKYHEKSETWSHRARGDCPCGTVHAPGDPSDDKWKPHKPSGGAKVHNIGDSPNAKIVATYDYETTKGVLMYQVCRTEPKSFKQRRPDGDGDWLWTMKETVYKGRKIPEQRTTLYRLPELIPGLAAGDTVWFVEGEKDVESLRTRDQIATCNTGGAGKWRDELARAFKNADPNGRVIIVQDRDPKEDHQGRPHLKGQKHARQVFEALEKVLPEGFDLTIVEARSGKDATDHLQAGHAVTDFDLVWPISGDLLDRDPQAFKRHMLHRALESPKTVLSIVVDDPEERERRRHQPIFKTGLRMAPFGHMWRGCVAISGEPSAGKSYIAISTGIDAALDGFDTWFLSCEMHQDLVLDRAARAVASHGMSDFDLRSSSHRTEAINRARRVALPDTWTHIDVGIGVTIEMIVELLADNVTHRPTLVILDSISSFVDSMESRPGDSFGMENLRHVTSWTTGVRKLTSGHISWLLLSELNKEGRAKGRSLDHRCDMAISVKTDEEHADIKNIAITKSWWGRAGPLGGFVLDWELGRLRAV